MARMFSKGNLRGRRLSPEQVLWGRAEYDKHVASQGRAGLNMREIAEVQGVSRETVARYLRGETWKQFSSGFRESQEMHEMALQQKAQLEAPSANSAEIQASLAKLAQLGIDSGARIESTDFNSDVGTSGGSQEEEGK